MNTSKNCEIIEDQTTTSLNTNCVTRNLENNGRKKLQEKRLE